MTSTRPRGQAGERRDDRWQPEAVEGRERRGEYAEGAADGAPRDVEVAAEAAEARRGDGEVELALGLEAAALRLGQDAVAQRARLGACQRRMLERDELAV